VAEATADAGLVLVSVAHPASALNPNMKITAYPRVGRGCTKPSRPWLRWPWKTLTCTPLEPAGRQNRWLYVLSLLAFITASSRNLHAVMPDRHISQYGHRSWKIEDGYLGAPPYSIAQDRDGYLWFGTYYGLYRFDGVRFIRWMPPPGMQLPSSKITSLLADRDGSLWMGTEFGLAHWKDGRLDNYLEHAGWIHGFEQDPDGAVWFAVRSYNENDARVLCKIRDGAMTCYGSKDGLTEQIAPPTQFVRDDAGYLWTSTSTSVIGWKNSSLQVYSPDFLKNKSGNAIVTGLAVDGDGSLLAGGLLGLYRIRHGQWTPVSAPGFDGRKLNVQCIFKDRHDAIWIGTRDAGLYRLYRGEVEHFGRQNGLSADQVWAILEDREGMIWVATDQGVDSFRDLAVLTLPKSVLGVSEIDNLFTTRDGTLWLGAEGGLLDRREGDRGFSPRGGNLRGKQATIIFEDRRGRMWIGVDNTLNIFEGDSFKPVPTPDGGPVGMIVSMAEDTRGDLWAVSLGPPRHIIRIDPDTRRISSIPDMPETSKIARDPGGGLWLGLNTGDLNHYDKGELTAYPLHHGPNTRIQQLTVLENGDVLAAAEFGLIQWRNRNVRVLDEHGGLPCSDINDFAFDLQGNLWLYTECGLAELTESDFKSWQRDPSHKVQPRILDRLDGVQITFPPFEGAARTRDGTLWFNSEFALQIVEPSRITTNLLPPPVHIETVTAERISYSPQDGLRLPKLTHDIEIDYTALSFIAPQKMRFRYMLSGVDHDWQDVEGRRQAFYMNLKPGAYTFRVIACNNDGVWNEAGDILRFNIPPVFYQTNWFRTLSAVFFLAALFGLYQLRMRQLAHQYALRLEERVNERTRIARELHDTLLQNFQGLLLRFQGAYNHLPSRPEQARKVLGVALDRGVEAITAARDTVQQLRSPPSDSNELSSSIAALSEELRGLQTEGPSPAVEVALKGAGRELHPILRDEAYRITAEALRNAFRHAQAARIHVAICYADHEFRIDVKDNGKGIDPEVLKQGSPPGHWGLTGMRERAEAIGAELNVTSSNADGTEVSLRVPAVIAYAFSPVRRLRWFNRKRSSE
jgi:signal transduction histidine kinase/ligand-binding sensor domain-containing protein